jgi:acyl phosphate:glycerol-3-phosphate acyltransferase
MMTVALALVLAYLVGSFPTAYVVGRLKGVDVRTVGSGNMGATNVYRTLGVWPALLVLGVDAAKGALAALLLPRCLGLPNAALWGLGLGLVAMLGHSRPVFLGFSSGGKGVATAAGVFAGLVPFAFAAALASFAVTVGVTRYVSLGSLVAAVVLPLAVLATHGLRSAALLAALTVSVFVFWSHRANITRLRRGTERRLGRPGHDGTPPGAAAEGHGAGR